MSAKTRRNDGLQQRDKIAGLYANAYGLLAKGKRSELQAHHLLRALQLFKENRLAGALEKSGGDVLVDLQQTLSLLITDVLPAHVARHVHKSYNVVYVGEMFLGVCHDLFRAKPTVQWANLCKEMLADLGLPLFLNLDASGWIPPYATDEKILGIWAQRLHEAIPRAMCSGCQSVGENLRKLGGRYSRRESMLPFLARRFGIHNMYVPSSWKAPSGDPACCALHGDVAWDGISLPSRVVQYLKAIGCYNFADLASKPRIDLDFLSPDTVNGLARLLAQRDLQFRELTEKDKARQPVQQSIEDLDLTIRTNNSLKAEGIVTIEQLETWTEAALLKTPNIGRMSLNEIKEVLASKGRHLAG